MPQLTVVATCASAVEASQVLRTQHVDLLFLDIKMPQLLGTDFLRSLLEARVCPGHSGQAALRSAQPFDAAILRKTMSIFGT